MTVKTHSIDVTSSIMVNGVEKLNASGDVTTNLVRGANNGTGVVVGHVPTGASTGSTLQLVSLTTAERDNLVGANGMLIWNETTVQIEAYNAGWAAVGGESLAATLAIGNTTGGSNLVVSTGDSIIGADELTLVSTTTGVVTIDSGSTGTINIGVDATNAKTLNLDSGTTGALNIGTSAFAKTITAGNTTGATALTLQTGTGAMTFTAGGIFDVNASGAVTIDGTTITLTGTGAVSITSGATDNNLILATGNNGAGDSGDILADVGTATGTAGVITLGATNATAINIGRSAGTIGFFGATAVVQQTDIGALTDNTGGTADNTVAAVSGSGADATINDNFADLIDQINQLRTTLRNLGLMA